MAPRGLAKICTLLIVAAAQLVVRGQAAPVFGEPSLADQCLRDVIGGAVGPSGIVLPLKRALFTPECVQQLVVYFRKGGQYEFDVASVAEQATQYYTTTEFKKDGSEVIVLDIDDTALSQIELVLQLAATAGIDSLDDLDQLSTAGGAGLNLPRTSDLPALAPVQAFYKAVYDLGFSVAFITGRDRTYRAQTIENLAKAGYGGQCKRDKAGKPVRSEEPCYVALHTRRDLPLPAGDYKWRRRRSLVRRFGLTIVGSIGDQWSDLIGRFPPSAVWKLPNPVYSIA